MVELTRQKSKSTAEWAFSWDTGPLAAAASKQYSTESPELRPGINAKGFFNGFVIVNNSDVAFAVDFDCNPDRRRVIPAHSANNFSNLVPYQELTITNLSATVATTAGQVYLTVRNERDVLRSD